MNWNRQQRLVACGAGFSCVAALSTAEPLFISPIMAAALLLLALAWAEAAKE